MDEPSSYQAFDIEGMIWNESNIRWCLQHLECAGCGRCCRELTEGVKIAYDEAKEIARGLGMSNKEFYKLVTKHPEYCVIGEPCRFLKNNRCSINSFKPKTCLIYPLYYRKESQWITIVACPAGQKLIDKIRSNKTKSP